MNLYVKKPLEDLRKFNFLEALHSLRGVNEEEKHVSIYATAQTQIVHTDGLSEESVQHIVNVISMYSTRGRYTTRLDY